LSMSGVGTSTRNRSPGEVTFWRQQSYCGFRDVLRFLYVGMLRGIGHDHTYPSGINLIGMSLPIIILPADIGSKLCTY
jgi:hypothetical protein